MPLAVYILGVSVFALGTSEFMLAGLIPTIANDLGVSIPQAGLLISGFAIGMVIGAPLLAVATLRLPRRTTMLVLLGVFGLGHIAGALAPSYPLLFASRVISALACAGFWAVAGATAVSLVPAGARGRALAVVTSGLGIANIFGVPAGTFLGQHAGWRSAFWAVTVMTAIALVGVATMVPGGRHGTPSQTTSIGRELRIYRNGRIWLAISTIVLLQSGVFCAFSYLTPLLTDVSGLTEASVPAVLALFGLGGLIGNLVGGRVADSRPFGTLYLGVSAVIVILALLFLSAHNAPATITLTLLLGIASFLTGPTLSTRFYILAPDMLTLAGASATSAFNIGNTAGPWIGGRVIDAGWGYPSVAWVGSVLAVTALGTVVWAAHQHRVPVTAPPVGDHGGPAPPRSLPGSRGAVKTAPPHTPGTAKK